MIPALIALLSLISAGVLYPVLRSPRLSFEVSPNFPEILSVSADSTPNHSYPDWRGYT